MKKILLILCLIVSGPQLSYAEPHYGTDPEEMIMHLQRVINTSTKPEEIVEADRLIREVYGPLCRERSWKRFKYTAAGVVSFAVLMKLSHKISYSLAGTAGLLGYMAYRDEWK
jgi:hypothetical protein